MKIDIFSDRTLFSVKKTGKYIMLYLVVNFNKIFRNFHGRKNTEICNTLRSMLFAERMTTTLKAACYSRYLAAAVVLEDGVL